MNLNFFGGVMDGATLKVPDEHRWDSVELCGIANSNNLVVATYRATETGKSGDSVEFEYAPDAVLEPDETARVIQMEGL